MELEINVTGDEPEVTYTVTFGRSPRPYESGVRETSDLVLHRLASLLLERIGRPAPPPAP